MPEVEYIKKYERPSGRVIKKGLRGHVSRKKAKELEDAGVAVVVGGESNKDTLQKTSEINESNSGSTKKKGSKKSSKSKKDED